MTDRGRPDKNTEARLSHRSEQEFTVLMQGERFAWLCVVSGHQVDRHRSGGAMRKNELSPAFDREAAVGTTPACGGSAARNEWWKSRVEGVIILSS